MQFLVSVCFEKGTKRLVFLKNKLNRNNNGLLFLTAQGRSQSENLHLFQFFKTSNIPAKEGRQSPDHLVVPMAS